MIVGFHFAELDDLVKPTSQLSERTDILMPPQYVFMPLIRIQVNRLASFLQPNDSKGICLGFEVEDHHITKIINIVGKIPDRENPPKAVERLNKVLGNSCSKKDLFSIIFDENDTDLILGRLPPVLNRNR